MPIRQANDLIRKMHETSDLAKRITYVQALIWKSFGPTTWINTANNKYLSFLDSMNFKLRVNKVKFSVYSYSVLLIWLHDCMHAGSKQGLASQSSKSRYMCKYDLGKSKSKYTFQWWRGFWAKVNDIQFFFQKWI